MFFRTIDTQMPIAFFFFFGGGTICMITNVKEIRDEINLVSALIRRKFQQNDTKIEGARHRHRTYFQGAPAKLTNILLNLINYIASYNIITCNVCLYPYICSCVENV